MLIIADKRIPAQAADTLSQLGSLILFETSGITADSISGHPDIFFCQLPNKLVIAQNLTEYYKEILRKHQILFEEGSLPVGSTYPSAAHYNAVVTDSYLIHRSDITDNAILKNCKENSVIHVQQGFTRCSLIHLSENDFITSDKGICKTMESKGFNVYYVDPAEILLPGQKHGFIGGCCGIHDKTIYVLGNFNSISNGTLIREFIINKHYKIVELYDGPLFDGGSILFIS